MQLRLATIVCNLPRREKQKQMPPIRPPKPSKEQAIANSKHKLVVKESSVVCEVCLSKCNYNSASVWDFIASNCYPAFAHNPCTPIVINGLVRIGNKISHVSHILYSYRGVKYCSQCGYMAQKLMKSLAKPCHGLAGRSVHGQRILDAINSNTLPPGLDEWPEDNLAEIQQERSSSSAAPVPNASPDSGIHSDAGTNVNEGQLPHNPPCIPKISPPRSLADNLADLLDLHDCGEIVCWPNGFNKDRALRYLSDIKNAFSIAKLYRKE